MAIDYSRPYTGHWRVFRVNPATWADAEQVAGVDSVSITRDSGGDAPEIDSGELEVSASGGWEFVPGYYRIVMTAEQSGQVERVEIATLLCESEGGEIDHDMDVKSVTGRSVLHPAAVTHVQPGEHVPKGGDGAAHAARLLRACVAAPVDVEGGFTLDETYAFEYGTSHLEAAWQVLDAAGWCMQIDGGGRVEIRPKPTDPALTLDRANARLLMPGIEYELDYSDVPNRFTAIEDGEVAQAVNATGSPASHDARGYWHDETDDAPKRVNGETLQAYAARRLEELSTVPDTRKYTREFAPGVRPFDVVRGSMASVRLDGDLRVVSQDIECDHGITVAEEAAREVKAWTR